MRRHLLCSRRFIRRRLCSSRRCRSGHIRGCGNPGSSRAEKMEQLYPVGYGLAAIIGLNERQVTAIVDSVHTAETPVFVGNINAPRQIVIAGSIEAMQRVLKEARRHGARKAELLHVSVPSHCPLLSSVADSLRLQLNSMQLKSPKFPYIANVTGRALRQQWQRTWRTTSPTEFAGRT